MTVQPGLCPAWSEPKLLVFSCTGSFFFFLFLGETSIIVGCFCWFVVPGAPESSNERLIFVVVFLEKPGIEPATLAHLQVLYLTHHSAIKSQRLHKNNECHVMNNRLFAYTKTKMQISCAVTDKLLSFCYNY